jgi:hypothetical protein
LWFNEVIAVLNEVIAVLNEVIAVLNEVIAVLNEVICSVPKNAHRREDFMYTEELIFLGILF